MDASKTQPLKLGQLDPIKLSAADGFLAVGKFLRAYFDRTEGCGDLATLCADVEVEKDQISTDPAALSDWQQAVTDTLTERADQRPSA